MKISIGFSRTNGYLSKTIRWFLGSDISHVYIKIEDLFLGTTLVLHADLPGVVFEDYDLFAKKNEVIEEYTIEDRRLNKSIKKNLRLLGRRYDYMELFGWAWTIAFRRWFKKKVKKPFDDPKKLICVDFAVKILNDAEISQLPNCELNPQTFRNWIRNNIDKGFVLTYHKD